MRNASVHTEATSIPAAAPVVPVCCVLHIYIYMYIQIYIYINIYIHVKKTSVPDWFVLFWQYAGRRIKTRVAVRAQPSLKVVIVVCRLPFAAAGVETITAKNQTRWRRTLSTGPRGTR